MPGHMGLIPGCETKIPHAEQYNWKKKKKIALALKAGYLASNLGFTTC